MEITKNTLLERKQFLYNREYSTETIQSYYTDMKLYTDFLKLEKQGTTIYENDITLVNIEKWRTCLKQAPTPKTSIYYTIHPTLSPSTIQSKLTAIKSFLKYLNLIYDTWLDYRKIDTKRIKSDYIEYITEDEYRTLSKFIWNFEKYKINALRMQLLCNIGYTSGLRLSEMLGLTITEIENWESRITWKGNKPRRVYFTHSTQKLLQDYLEERARPIPWTWKTENRSDFVFISHNSWYDYWNVIKKNTVCEKMKKISDALDIWKRITVHTLRHSYATRLLESWMNIREIQELLGHSDLKTTQWYIHILKSNLKQRVNNIFD